ncbi:uncharacterized protein BDZ99DRAFT_516682 [Mytilinidion resinicola]|uniref:Uncharacterized protein n=1 Tax=Mytilinidion resinicola TaxID=574789 RepID=A0A6A6YZ81_9PEZI|nr:uncharacterized protein BDZ99DRAFT_516682 [Mytilinidion resinicola]KAF2814060.1 hypothetical protein BDZ99DRAFT_516682 [Mytilinidion resinicola]
MAHYGPSSQAGIEFSFTVFTNPHFFRIAHLTKAANALNSDDNAKAQANSEKEFKVAHSLHGYGGFFSSVHRYTTLQPEYPTQQLSLSAIQAPINTNTIMFLSLWGPSTADISNKIAVLKKLSSDQTFADLVGISVCSEDA